MTKTSYQQLRCIHINVEMSVPYINTQNNLNKEKKKRLINSMNIVFLSASLTQSPHPIRTLPVLQQKKNTHTL